MNHKLSMIIKIFCLSIGMAASLLIVLYVFHEYSFDEFHQQKDSIYQVVVSDKNAGGTEISAVATAGIGPSLQQEFPEIQKMCRLSTPKETYFTRGDVSLISDDLLFADSTFFEIFSFKMLQGSPEHALDEPFTMVVTPEFAGRYFGDADPVGKILQYGGKYNFMITGLAEKAPSNSHIQYNALLSFSSLYKMDGYYMDWDGGWGYNTYVKASDKILTDAFQKKLVPFLEKHINYKLRNYGAEISLGFDPMTEVYLHSQAPESQVRSGNTNNLLVFSVIGFFILLIACINFINISTAQFSQRTRETGIRKVLGADRSSLIRQFMAETLLLSFFSLIIALLLVELLMPGFNRLFNSGISMQNMSSVKIIVLSLFTGLITGLLAGLYPSFFLSGFSPVKVLKGGFLKVNKGRNFRNILVVIQFFLATGLIICTLMVYHQISFFMNKPLGYDRAQYMILSLTGNKSMAGYKLLKNELKSIPDVVGIGASTAIPGQGATRNGYIPEGQKDSKMFYVMDVDQDFLSSLGIGIIRGAGFVSGAQPDAGILVNRALAKSLGWENPIGKTLARNGTHKIIGVVNDFHFEPMYQPIQPLIITNIPWEGSQEGFNYLVLRLTGSNTAGVITKVENIWRKHFPSEPYVFHFMDQVQASMYDDEKSFGSIFTWASILAVFIAGLGLFGLTTFIIQQRRKEIGIRKTFGANASGIVWLLGRQYITLVVAGNVLAWPAAWLIMQRWIQNYAYTAPFGWWIFALTLIFTVLFAFATVAWQSVKASLQNPVDSLRYE